MKKTSTITNFREGSNFYISIFKKTRCYACYLLKLRRQMSGAAVVKLPCDLRKSEIIIQKQLLYAFDLMKNNEMFDRNIFHFRKNFREIGIVRF